MRSSTPNAPTHSTNRFDCLLPWIDWMELIHWCEDLLTNSSVNFNIPPFSVRWKRRIQWCSFLSEMRIGGEVYIDTSPDDMFRADGTFWFWLAFTHDGAGAYVKGQHAGCPASGQPLTAATRKTLFPGAEALLLRSLPPGEGRVGWFDKHLDILMLVYKFSRRFWVLCIRIRSKWIGNWINLRNG